MRWHLRLDVDHRGAPEEDRFLEQILRIRWGLRGINQRRSRHLRQKLGGKTVGTLSASSYLCYLEKTYPNAKIVTYPNADALYLDLTSGRLDTVFADAVATDFGLLRTDAGKNMAIASEVISDRECFGEGAGIGLRKEDAELREAFNKAIVAVREDGTYEKIAKKYFAYDIYGD
ncbi:transporter substrate-binding domain-containing protein [Mesorhizobium sp. 1M-11]|uniref:transporter substrate-binding domain-containing protein n=1 Tax=Mesorhizobium sp. 1M-11 TaxID=1529006 RepID=UPI00244E67D7|nr:transporter substrate-binding domain-containing protein [Mesorhizobium sp. 1M-11]